MLIKSKLDPSGMAGFFKKMQQNARYYYTANIPAILRTHPMDEDRIAEAENRSLHLKTNNYVDSLDYRLFKEIIRNIVSDQNKQISDYYQTQCYKHNTAIACQYGYALALINNNQHQKAKEKLALLLTQDPDNLYYVIAMAQTEIALKNYLSATSRLRELQANYPENYAALISYAQILLDADQAEEAAKILLQGSREFKQDIALCQQLARAQAASHHKDYAYFTEAQCELLQGRKKEALRRLKTAQQLSTKDHLLKERITAKIDEIKYLLDK
jgi:predicted Zn-dependent protease